jgi:MFS family permease
MALFSGATLFGTGVGPLVSSLIASRTTWRWICYSQAMVSAGFVALLYFFFAETREAVLLSRMADDFNSYFDAM